MASHSSHESLLTSIGLLAMNQNIPHPDPQASDRERLLWESLKSAHAEISRLQTSVHRLLDLNLKYAEQLQSAMVGESSKRARLSQTDTLHTMSSPATTLPAGSVSSPLTQQQQHIYFQPPPPPLRTPIQSTGRFEGDGQAYAVAAQTPEMQVQIVQADQQRARISEAASALTNIHTAESATFASQAAMVAAAASAASDPQQQLQMQSLGLRATTVPEQQAAGLALPVPRQQQAAQPAVRAPQPAITTVPLLTSQAISVAAVAQAAATHQQSQKRKRTRSRQQKQPVAHQQPVAQQPQTQQPQQQPQQQQSKQQQQQQQPQQQQQLTLAVPEQSAANDTQDDQAPQATGTENLTVGDPESIPSIGKFESIRALYEYRAESEEYDRVNSNKWREKMDSRRRQNWSRITAVYTRIQQLRHGDESEESLERAIQIATDEMAREGMTLTKYSQTVRKTINEARKSSRRAQDVADASPDGEEGIRLQPPTQPTQPTQQQQQQSLQMLIGHQTQQQLQQQQQQYQQQQQQRLPNPTGY